LIVRIAAGRRWTPSRNPVSSGGLEKPNAAMPKRRQVSRQTLLHEKQQFFRLLSQPE